MAIQLTRIARAASFALVLLSACIARAEDAAEIEVTYYHDDGQDELGIVFVGPPAAAIM